MADAAPMSYDYTHTTFFFTEPLSDLVQRLEDVFRTLSVDVMQCTRVKYWYACTAMNNGSFLRFEVTLFGHEDGHMVELRPLSGCPFAFSHFAYDVARAMGTTFIGGGKPIPMSPPAFDDPFPEITDAAKRDTCRFVLDTLATDASWRTIMQGLRRMGAMAADEKPAEYFYKGGYGVPLALRAATFYTLSKGDHEARAITMNALAEVVSLPNVCPSVAEAVVLLLPEALHDPNMHVRKDAQRIAAALGVDRVKDRGCS